MVASGFPGGDRIKGEWERKRRGRILCLFSRRTIHVLSGDSLYEIVEVTWGCGKRHVSTCALISESQHNRDLKWL